MAKAKFQCNEEKNGVFSFNRPIGYTWVKEKPDLYFT